MLVACCLLLVAVAVVVVVVAIFFFSLCDVILAWISKGVHFLSTFKSLMMSNSFLVR